MPITEDYTHMTVWDTTLTLRPFVGSSHEGSLGVLVITGQMADLNAHDLAWLANRCGDLLGLGTLLRPVTPVTAYEKVC